MMNRKVAFAFLALGTLLFAVAPPVLKLLTTMGGRLGLQMPGAISFCNVLFVGNFLAGIVALAFGPRAIFSELKRLTLKTRIYLLLGALLSTIYPALLFTGLERTSVINVVLLSRFNGIVFVVLAFLFLRTMITRWEVVGYTVMAVGVTVLIVVNNRGMRIQTGELFVILSTVFFALTEIVSKSVLRECSIRTYVFFRNTVSAVIFFALGLYLFGFEHFSDAFGRELWILMVVYSGVAVVAAQVLWLSGSRVLPAQWAANFQLLNPAFSILFAYLLLSEVPGPLEWLVIGIILVGMLIPVIARRGATTGMTMGVETSLAGR